MTAQQWFTCSFCHTTRIGIGPVHGDGPCPMKVREHEAYVSLMETQKASYVNQGFMSGDMVAMLKKITGVEDDD